MPLVSDTLDALSGSQYFSTLDLKSGYWQIELYPSARGKTAFVTHNGLYEILVMPFGLIEWSKFSETYETYFEKFRISLCSDLR